ncbi:MAG: CCA tRNA nucleotidyltransferase [Oscillospiraceae bacterium]|nr:CCA tRNA nucleotidyltransferase [Oscillospiraceae bacterium]
MPDYIKQIISLLENAGHEAYAVGGCVRDCLLNRPCSDYDITTSALPDEVKKALCGITVIETGISHGTVTAVVNENPVEITTYREDLSYSDHRRPDAVRFSSSLCADLGRRDFTINALAYSEKSGIIDLYGGKADLEKGIIRTVGDAQERFNEDALRILRALRFSSQLEFEVEEKTAAACLSNCELLSFVSKERIYSELKKLICGKNAADCLLNFRQIIFYILPALETAHFDSALSALPLLPEDFALRFASLFYHIGSAAAADALRTLKADKKTTIETKTLIENLPLKAEMNGREIKTMLSKIGEEMFFKLIVLETAFASESRKAELKKTKTAAENIIKRGECYSLSTLKISGSDLASLEIEGRQIGQVLNRLLAAVINDEIPNEKSTLLEKAKLL